MKVTKEGWREQVDVDDQPLLCLSSAVTPTPMLRVGDFHLTRAEVKQMMRYLQTWVDTGHLKKPRESHETDRRKRSTKRR
jgi:hypothetical protein